MFRFLYLAYHLITIFVLTMTLLDTEIIPRITYLFLIIVALVLLGMDILKHLAGRTGLLRFMYIGHNILIFLFSLANLVNLETAFRVLFTGVLLFAIYQAWSNIAAIISGDLGGL